MRYIVLEAQKKFREREQMDVGKGQVDPERFLLTSLAQAPHTFNILQNVAPQKDAEHIQSNRTHNILSITL